jgi:hypothetical protein
MGAVTGGGAVTGSVFKFFLLETQLKADKEEIKIINNM